MTRVYASAIFCSTRLELDVARLRQSIGDAADTAWRTHIERSYRCALSFTFNDFYRRQIGLTHVRSSTFVLDGPIGEVWTDWVLLDDKRLATQSLHINFCFPALRLDLNNPQCPTTEAIAGFLKDVYHLSEYEQDLPGGLRDLSRLLCGVARGRQHALGISRYIYTSLACNDADAIASPSDALRVNLYRLLYQHAQGVDAAVASAMLPNPWGSAAFFRLYSQPGGMLSVSTPYPAKAHHQHDAWFNPTPPTLAEAPFPMAVAPSSGATADAYPSYDFLPEYPPLRYLAVPVLHYGAAYEETLRAVHESAFSSVLQRPLRMPWTPKPSKCHLLAANLEGIRLPVVRSLLNETLELQLQARTTNASMEMLRLRDTTRNVLLAIAGLILALAFIDPDKFILRDVFTGNPHIAAPAPAAPTAPVDPGAAPR